MTLTTNTMEISDYLFDLNTIPTGGAGFGYDIPAEALSDPQFAKDDPGSGKISWLSVCLGRCIAIYQF